MNTEVQRTQRHGVVYLKVGNYGSPDSYLTVDPNDSSKIKIKTGKSDMAKFRIHAPLQSAASNSNYVSFESSKYPNHYLRHAGFKLYLTEATPANMAQKVFVEDASWLFQQI